MVTVYNNQCNNLVRGNGGPRRPFCCAMLCISAAYAVMRSLSVRLSVTLAFVYSVKASNHILELFPPSGSHTILDAVLRDHTLWRYSDGNSRSRGVKYRWYEKLAILDQYPTLSRKWYKTGPQLLWNANRNSYAIYLMVPFPMTSSDWVAKYSITRTITRPVWDSWAFL